MQNHAEQNNVLNTLDSQTHYCVVDLVRHIDNKHLLKQLSLSISDATHLPISTVFLMGLGVFSSMSTRAYRVSYKYGGAVPIGLYVVAEQPSGTGKSWCLNTFQRPFYKAHKRHIAKCNAQLKIVQSTPPTPDTIEIAEYYSKAMQTPLFTTNTTPEALEQSLMLTKGFFSAVSSEQGLFNSLLGLMYGESKVSNNDLVLSGFNGDYLASMRVSRTGFSGYVAGGIVLFAQGGSVENILNQSKGTGLSERFLMLAEPHSLGKRKWKESKSINRDLVEDYDNICQQFIDNVLMNPCDFDETPILTISNEGWGKIFLFREELEPHLADGSRYSHISLRGAASKVDIQIMKIAANLHLLSGLNVGNVIEINCIDSAIQIMRDLMEANLAMLLDKEIIGAKAEYTAILKMFEGNNKSLTERQITNSRKCVAPFKDFTGNKYELIRKALNELVEHGVILKSVQGEKVTFSIG